MARISPTGATQEGRVCCRCGLFKPWDEYYYNGEKYEKPGLLSSAYSSACKACIRISNGSYAFAYRVRVRRECLEAYGGAVCVCCAETEFAFLSLDHENNDGAAHRRELIGPNRGSGHAFILALRRLGYPQDAGLRVLCYNCNLGRESNQGVCPHETARRSSH